MGFYLICCSQATAKSRQLIGRPPRWTVPGDLACFFKITLPLVQPGLICISVFNFVSIWNEYMLALVFASKQNLRTILLGMYALKDSMMYTSNWGGRSL